MVEQGAPHMALYPSGLVTMGAMVPSPAPSDNQPSVAIHRSPQHVACVPVMGTREKKPHRICRGLFCYTLVLKL